MGDAEGGGVGRKRMCVTGGKEGRLFDVSGARINMGLV